jgi:hypothetical protein
MDEVYTVNTESQIGFGVDDMQKMRPITHNMHSHSGETTPLTFMTTKSLAVLVRDH